MATKNVDTGATTFQITYSLSDGCTGEVSFSSDSSWLTLDGGSSSPRTVSVAQNNGQPRTGHITPSYKGSSCTNNVITVNQSGQTVDLCSSVECSGCSEKKSALDTAHTITWSIPGGSVSNLSISNSSTTLTNLSITVNTSSVSFSFDRNTSTTIEKSFNANASFTVTSGGVTTSCTVTNFGFTQAVGSVTCDCSNFALQNTATTVDQTGGTSITLNTITTSGTCITDVSASSNQTWITVGVNGSSITGTVTANTTTSAREATITVSYKANGSACSSPKTFKVTQAGTSCECSSLGINKDSVTVNAGASDTVTITPGCTTLGAVTVDDGTKATASLNGNTITITGKAAGTATVTLNYTASGSSCTKNISVTVNCPSYTINPSGGSGTGGTQTFTVS